jgi:fructose-1-phosphate kinase PfkB-like protein
VIYPAGGVIGRLLHKLLDEEGVASHNSTIGSETRGDFFVHEISTGKQYRLSFPARSCGFRFIPAGFSDVKPATVTI